jgi:hydroxymethylbilane synthase
VPERGDVRDALVGSTLAALGSGARVATGSARRRVQLANLRPDLCFVQLRGNIETRIARAGRGGVEAVVIAAAALARLSITPQADEIFSPVVMLPQVGQGALALECSVEDEALRALLAVVDDADAHQAVVAERAMLTALGASCSLPVGGWAERDGPELHLRGMAASPDGRVVLHADRRGTEPSDLGAQVARALLEDCGGASLLGLGAGAP